MQNLKLKQIRGFQFKTFVVNTFFIEQMKAVIKLIRNANAQDRKQHQLELNIQLHNQTQSSGAVTAVSRLVETNQYEYI